jgi:pimeloyl-[acyl-carrier protein] methyl ester esterase
VTRVRLPNGQNLNYLDVGQGPVLVLLHGWAMSSGVFADTVVALTKHFRLLVPDLPGHGQSDPGQDYSLAAFAADVETWLDTLQIDRYNLLGWSFGGQVALQLATNTKAEIERMVLVASTPKFCQSMDWSYGLPDIQVRAMQRQLRRDQGATLDEFVSLMFTGEANASVLDATLREQSILPDPEAGQETLVTLRLGDLRDQLAQISIPTLIHHGKTDNIIPVTAGQFLAEQIPNADISVFNDIGHAPFLSCPKQSQTLWKEFLL